jgi:hypothetical protein
MQSLEATPPTLSFDEIARLVHLEEKPLDLITEVEWDELKQLRAKERSGKVAARRSFTFGPLESYENLAADRCTRESLDELVLVPPRNVWDQLAAPVVVDGVVVRLRPFAWMTKAAFAAYDTEYRAMVDRLWAVVLPQIVFGEMGRKAINDPDAHARTAAKHEAKWRAERMHYGTPLEGDDRWEVRKVARAAGAFTSSEVFNYNAPVEAGFLGTLATHDPLLLLRMIEVEQERTWNEHAAFAPGGVVLRFSQELIRDQHGDPTTLSKTTENDASTFVTAMRQTLVSVASRELTQHSGNLNSLDTWWRRFGFERLALKIAREGL